MTDIGLRAGEANPNDVKLTDPTSVPVTGTTAVTFGFSESLTGTETINGAVAVAFPFSLAASGAETLTGTAAVAFGFSEALAGTETVSGSVAGAFGFSVAATGTETVSGDIAIAFGFSVAAFDETLPSLEPGSGQSHTSRELTGSGVVAFGFAVEATGFVNDDDLVLLLAA